MKFLSVLVIMFIAMFSLIGCEGGQTGRELHERLNRLENEIEDLQERVFKSSVEVYFIKPLEEQYVLFPESREIDERDGDPPELALEELMKGPDTDSDLLPVLPPHATILDFYLSQGVAYIDISPDVRALGDEELKEELMVYALVNTVTGFPGIQTAKILVDGQEAETLLGNVNIDDELFFNEELVYSGQ